MKHSRFHFTLLALTAASLLVASRSEASNLLSNPGFEANPGHQLPTSWNYFSPPTNSGYFGNYWVEGSVAAHSGGFYWKEWGALYLPAPTNNVAGIYQDFSSAPGSGYQASGWLFTKGNDTLGSDCRVWIEVSFLGATTNLLALY